MLSFRKRKGGKRPGEHFRTIYWTGRVGELPFMNGTCGVGAEFLRRGKATTKQSALPSLHFAHESSFVGVRASTLLNEGNDWTLTLGVPVFFVGRRESGCLLCTIVGAKDEDRQR